MMAAPSLAIQLAVLAGFAIGCLTGARILAVFPDPSTSHIIAYVPLTKQLAARGHHVTVISSHPQKESLGNYTDIAVPLVWFGTDSYHKALLNKDTTGGGLASMNYAGLSRCRHFLDHPDVQRLIHDDRQRFDLIIMEIDLHQCFLGLAHKYDTSIIGIYGHSGSATVHDLVGAPSPPSYVPDIFHFYTDRLNGKERMSNLDHVMNTRLGTRFNNEHFDVLTGEYFKHLAPLPKTVELQRRFAFLFFNNDVSLHFPRPYMPNVVDIAGMHIQPAGKLPQDLQVLLDEAKHGVIVFCMGSVLGNFLNSSEKIQTFADAFSKLKQLVIWKRKEPIPGLVANIRVLPWLPLADIFAHPNVRAFVTHGGLLSLQEAVYHAVPIIGIPICADQFFNIQRAVDLGFARRLDYDTFTSEELRSAVHAVITDESYRIKASEASYRFRDQLTPPLDKAVFWTEYVLRHNGAKHLRSAGMDLNIYQYLLLDVFLVILLAAILFSLVVYAVFSLCRTILFASECEK